MKRFIQSSVLLMVLSLAVACGEKEPVWVAPTHTMSVEQSDLLFEPLGGSRYFMVKAENPFTVATDRDWCTASVDGSEIEVTVTANPHNETRYARVNLTSGDEKLGITVQQTGIIIKGFTPKDTLVNGNNHVFQYNYTSNSGDPNVTSPQDWITVSQATGTITITVASNGEGVRNGTVNYALGTLKGSFIIKQFPTFTENADWTSVYKGKFLFEEKEQEIFGLNVAPGSAGLGYAMMMLSEADFKAKGQSMADYIQNGGWSDVLDAQVARESAKGGSSLADWLYTDSVMDTLATADYPAGNWYMIAVGLTPEGEPTGKYAAPLVSNAAASYASWLGTWAATDDRGFTYTLTIAQKESGASYTVSGFKGTNVPLNAVYNADGTLSLAASSTTNLLFTGYESGGYTYSTLYALGVYNRLSQNSVLTGGYNFGFSSHRSETEAVIMGRSYQLAGKYYPFVQLVLRGNCTKGTSSYTNRVLERTYLPITLVKQ